MPDKRLLVVYGVVAAAAGVGAFWFLTRARMERAERRDFVKRYRQMISTRAPTAAGATEHGESEEEQQAVVKVIFGSESGNAEALAKGLVQTLQDHKVPSVLIDPSEWGCFDRFVEQGGACAGGKRASPLFAPTRPSDSSSSSAAPQPIIYVFVAATTGEGQAPANLLMLQSEMTTAVEQYEARVKQHGSTGAAAGSAAGGTPDLGAPFAGVHYAVFGLGDTSYKYFCKCGTTVNTLLRKGGGTEVYKIGFGDAKKKHQEDDFDEWVEQLLAALTNKCGIPLATGSLSPPKPTLELRYVTPAAADATTETTPAAAAAAAAAASTTATGASAPRSTAVVSASPFPPPPALLEPSLGFPVPLTVVRKTPVTEARDSDGSYVLRLTVSTAYDARSSNAQATASSSSSAPSAATPSCTLQYQAGDHFGVFARNPPSVVARFAKLLSLTEAQLHTPVELCACARMAVRTVWYNTLPGCVSLQTALERYVDLCGRPRRSALRVLAKYCTLPAERDALLAMLRPTSSASATTATSSSSSSAPYRTTLDYIEAFPSCAKAIPLGHLLELVGRLQPRYYSIASDPLSHGDCLEIYLRVVTDGLASQYLSGHVEEGDAVFAFVRPSNFHLPANVADGRPVIMIGPGTGVAAMVGLCYRREAVMWRKASARYGPCLFYFGAQHRASEYFVREELERWASAPADIDAYDAAHADSHASLAAHRQRPNKRTHLPTSLITDLQLAFSRDQDEKLYVTHLMERQLDVLHTMLTNTAGGGCVVFVSGDAAAMAKEVDRILAKALQEKGGMSRLASLEFLRNMEQERRLLKDVY